MDWRENIVTQQCARCLGVKTWDNWWREPADWCNDCRTGIYKDLSVNKARELEKYVQKRIERESHKVKNVLAPLNRLETVRIHGTMDMYAKCNFIEYYGDEIITSMYINGEVLLVQLERSHINATNGYI